MDIKSINLHLHIKARSAKARKKRKKAHNLGIESDVIFEQAEPLESAFDLELKSLSNGS